MLSSSWQPDTGPKLLLELLELLLLLLLLLSDVSLVVGNHSLLEVMFTSCTQHTPKRPACTASPCGLMAQNTPETAATVSTTAAVTIATL
jgi:hypothetical protein